MNVDNFFSSRFSGLYKAGPAGRSRKSKRNAKDLEESRRDKRRETANANRNIDDDDAAENIPPDPVITKAEKRLQRLLNWKRAKEEALQLGKNNIKKPFVVGIVRHKINSPITEFKKPLSSGSENTGKKPVFGSNRKTVLMRETRTESKKKTIFTKPESPKFGFSSNVKPSMVYKFNAIHGSSSKKLTLPMSPIFMRREAAKKLQLKNYLTLDEKKKSTKSSSSDEELATPLSPPTRVTRSQRKVHIIHPKEEKKIKPPAGKKRPQGNMSDESGPSTSGLPQHPTRSRNQTTGQKNLPQGNMSDESGPSTSGLPQHPTRSRNQTTGQKNLPQGNMSDESGPSTSGLPQRPTRSQNQTTGQKNLETIKTPDSKEIQPVNNNNSVERLEQKLSTDSEPETHSDITDVANFVSEEVPCGSTSVEKKSNKDEQNTPPANYSVSPFVTIGRGKQSARRSNISKPSSRQKISLRDVPAPDEPADGPTFQKARLNNEASRLLLLADEWEKYARLENINQDTVDDIDLVVGQTRLLTRDKFKQFRILIEQHEADLEKVKVTLDDLNGFWEMMYLQVENLNKKYERLEMLKSNNWVEPEISVKQKPAKGRAKKRVVAAKSSVRDFIKASKINSEQTCLLKKVLTPIAKKRRSSARRDSPAAFNALRLSFTAKDFGTPPTILVTENVVPNVTPKSCLKTKPIEEVITSTRKTVLFDQNVTYQDIQDENSASPAQLETEDGGNLKTPNNRKRRTVQTDNDSFFTPRRSARLSIKHSTVTPSS